MVPPMIGQASTRPWSSGVVPRRSAGLVQCAHPAAMRAAVFIAVLSSSLLMLSGWLRSSSGEVGAQRMSEQYGFAPRKVSWIVWVLTFPIWLGPAVYLLVGSVLYRVVRVIEWTSDRLADFAGMRIAIRQHSGVWYLNKDNPYPGFLWPLLWPILIAFNVFALLWNLILGILRLGWEASREILSTIASMAFRIWEAVVWLVR